jgi:hypothetical protein
MEKITIKEIQRINKHSDKKDKDYVSVVIVDEQGRKMSGFSDETNKNWKVGQEVEVDIEKKGGYLNFRLPRKFEHKAERSIYSSLFEEIISNFAKELIDKFGEFEERIDDLERRMHKMENIGEKIEEIDDVPF